MAEELKSQGSMSDILVLDAEDERAVAQIQDRVGGLYDAMLLRCAIELDLFEIINRISHPTLPQMAAALSPHPVNTNHLARVLRYLADMQLVLFREGTYSLSRASERFLLRRNSSGRSLRSMVLVNTDEYVLSGWHNLSTTLLAGGMRQGAGIFDAMAQRPELGALFNDTMATNTRLLMPAVLRAVSGVLGEARSMVDVGGGTGALAALAAEAHPGLRCTVLELPEVVRASAAATTGVTFIEGSMFDHIPSADVLLLKRILHDWEDDDCLNILRQCKNALPSHGGKLVIIEVVMEEDEDNLFNKHKLRTDLGMMFFGGKERSKEEWSSLLFDAGFFIHKVTPAILGQSVIEAHPKEEATEDEAGVGE